MDKNQFVANIQKYYLGGLVESVKWDMTEDKTEVKFLSTENSMAGSIVYSFITDEDKTIGVYNTTELLKILAVMGDEVTVDFEKTRGTYLKMIIADPFYRGTYSLADIGSIPEAPEIEEPSTYDVTFDLTPQFKDQFMKAYKALGSINRFTIEASDTIKIVLGDKASYSNKISFNTESFEYLPLAEKAFSAQALFEILKLKTTETGKIHVSDEGLMKVELSDEVSKSNYFLVELEEV